MTWADFYLICFVVGFTLSLLSIVGGGLRWHLHLPHFPHAHSGGAHLHLGGGPAAPAPAGTGNAPARSGQVSPFNFVSFTAFLAWFGGIGYLLTRFSSVWFLIALGIALLGGLTGAAIVYLFLSRVLTSEEENLDPADYEMTGVLGRTSVPIRRGGTGEIIYSQAGTRRTCGARSENGGVIPKGNEVVVTRYEKGIAYVRLWSELSGETSESSNPEVLDQPERKDAP
jgi:membrane protein implicated in regulation of membrane protease activity